MLVAIGQPRLRVGDVRYNAQQVIQCIEAARAQRVQAVLFGRMALLGGVWAADWNTHDAMQAQGAALDALRPYCAGLQVVIGVAAADEGQNGVCNAVRILQGERAEEDQLLMPDALGRIALGDGLACGVIPGSSGDAVRWMAELQPADDRPHLLVHMASHEDWGPQDRVCASRCGRSQDLRSDGDEQAANIPPMLIVRHAGVVDHHVETQGLAIFADGQMRRLECECGGVYVFDAQDLGKLCQRTSCKMSDTQEPYRLLVHGLREFFAAQGLRRALVGLSGGIDSAVVLAIAAEALGAENVLAVFMPSRYSSQASAEDAESLAHNLGVEYHVVPIDAVCQCVEGALGDLLAGERDATEENIQARARGLMLMAIANKRGYALLNTSNRSEAAVGYSTMYGDMCGAVAVIGDLYKGEVYEAARWVNRVRSVIPERIITRAPSAELREGQTDQDSLPEYDVLDTILMALLEEHASMEDIVRRGFSAQVVRRVMQLVQGSAFKRAQMPPILKVSRGGFQRRVADWPLGAKWPVW